MQRRGISLIEVILSVIVIAILAAIATRYVMQPRSKVSEQACEVQRMQIQLQVDLYRRSNGSLPSALLTELSTPTNPLPVCSVDGRPYVLDTRSGRVISHQHP